MNTLHFTVTIFYILYYISFNSSPTKSYYTPNSSKCYEDSAEFSRFLITALKNDLQPLKPVHFFSCHPLGLTEARCVTLSFGFHGFRICPIAWSLFSEGNPSSLDNQRELLLKGLEENIDINYCLLLNRPVAEHRSPLAWPRQILRLGFHWANPQGHQNWLSQIPPYFKKPEIKQ